MEVEARAFWEFPLWARVVWLVVLGAFTPFIVSIAMVITAFLGPLAFVAGPVLGTWVSVVLARHCQQYAPPRRFWIYPVSVVSVYGLILAAAFWPGGPNSGGHEPSLGGAQAAVAGGIVLLLVLGSSVFWLLGLAIGGLKKDNEEPSFP